MSNEEAIKMLRTIQETVYLGNLKFYEAIDVAIKALGQNPCQDAISRQAAIDARRYTFGNDEFSLEAAYHDCKLIFDGITDDDSFQEADTGTVLYYANEIIYALQEALKAQDVPDTNVGDMISRQAAIDTLKRFGAEHGQFYRRQMVSDALSHRKASSKRTLSRRCEPG